jgi:hypothetical protein
MRYFLTKGGNMLIKNIFPMAVVPISVIMFFAGLGTVVFWLGRFLGGAFPQKIPLDPAVHNAFAIPDFLKSILLFIGTYGLLRLKNSAFLFP